MKSHAFGATVACLSLIACKAYAQDLEDEDGEAPPRRTFKIPLQAGLRYGTRDLNLGFGARGGFQLPNHMWLGGSFDYFLGFSRLVEASTGTDNYRVWNVGGEVGYDFDIDEGFSLRPYLGLGLAHADETLCARLDTGERCISPVRSNAKGCTLGWLLRYTIGIFSVSGDVRRRSVVEGWNLFDSAAWTSAWVFGAETGVVF
jgi:Autotransporter beta-domain